MAAEEGWVGIAEVAAHLQVARDTVYRWVDTKGLPAHRVGRLLRFRLSEVDEWVKAGGTLLSSDVLAEQAIGRLFERLEARPYVLTSI